MLIFSSVFIFLDSTRVVHDSQHKEIIIIIILTIFYSGS